MAAMEAKKVDQSDQQEVQILWSSQTGASEEIARQIYQRGKDKGHVINLSCTSDFEPADLANKQIAIFVLSSTGEGDPPENGIKFMSKLKKYQRDLKDQAKTALSQLSITILGLGDSNYSSYQSNPRTLHRLLTSLGATYFYPRSEVDEVKGLESQVEKWIAGLWEPLEELLASKKQETESKKEPETPTITTITAATSSDNVKVEKEVLPVKSAAKVLTRRAIKVKAVPDTPPNRIILKNVTASPQPVKCKPISNDCGLEVDTGRFVATVTNARWLTHKEAKKQVIELTIRFPRDYPDYQAGDSIGVHCCNETGLVNKLIERLAYSEEDVDQPHFILPHDDDPKTVPSHLNSFFPCSVRQMLKWGTDLCSAPKKTFLRMLADYCTDQTESEQLIHLSSIKGKAEYERLIQTQPNLLDLLSKFPSCHPKIDHLLSLLPPMKPRYYSYASHSASSDDAKEAKIAFSLVDVVDQQNQVIRHGICTHWLCSNALRYGLLPNDGRYTVQEIEECANRSSFKIPVEHKASLKFRLPASVSAGTETPPLIMIGPGTGVAPFIGFLEQIQASSVRPFTWLLFGCRSQNLDFIYQDEINEFLKDGTLNQFTIACSRETEQVVYVQHKLVESGDQVGDLLDQGASIYVCGDTKGMLTDISNAVSQILKKRKNLTDAEAKAALTKLIVDNRLIFDVWV